MTKKTPAPHKTKKRAKVAHPGMMRLCSELGFNEAPRTEYLVSAISVDLRCAERWRPGIKMRFIEDGMSVLGTQGGHYSARCATAVEAASGR